MPVLPVPHSPLLHQRFLLSSIQILLPFHGKQLLFGGIARLAGRHDIAFCTLSTAADRDDMIHGQLFGGCGVSAVAALSYSEPPFPPLGVSELPGPLSLPFYRIRIHVQSEPGCRSPCEIQSSRMFFHVCVGRKEAPADITTV